MFNPAYLAKSQTGIFYLRWPIPRELHPQKRASSVKVSLSTRDPKKALRLARPLIQIGMDLNEDGIAQKMRYDELRSLLTEHFKTQLQNKKAEIDAEGRLTAQQRTEIEELASVTRQAQTDGGRLATQDVDDDELLRRLVAKFQLPISPKSKQYGWLRTEIANP